MWLFFRGHGRPRLCRSVPRRGASGVGRGGGGVDRGGWGLEIIVGQNQLVWVVSSLTLHIEGARFRMICLSADSRSSYTSRNKDREKREREGRGMRVLVKKTWKRWHRGEVEGRS